jgi:hypothetical protein
MNRIESTKRETNTSYPPNLVTLAPNHVNGARRSRGNEVKDQWIYMMIKSLLRTNTSRYTPTTLVK